jgi:hypothetical protein
MSSLTISHPPAAAGLVWIKQGWSLFRLAPIPWTGMTAFVFLVLMGVGALPWVGGLAVYLLSPFIVAGYFSASRAGAEGRPITFLNLGAGFQGGSTGAGRQALLVIGGVYTLGIFLIFRVVTFFTGGDLALLLQSLQGAESLSPEQTARQLQVVTPALLLGSLLMTPLLMATWFAPGLVLFEGFPAGKALWWSLWACVVNWRPILNYTLLLGLLGVVAMLIPLGLGLLVFLPWTLTATFAAYRAIFTPIGAGPVEST